MSADMPRPLSWEPMVAMRDDMAVECSSDEVRGLCSGKLMVLYYCKVVDS